MSRWNIVLTAAILAGGTILAQPAAGQAPMTYAPQSPAVSPWMGLWQQNTGALDNYHTFVQPQMEVNAALQMQGAALNRQAARLQALNNDIAQPQRNPGGMVPTGQGATFMSYSHYFGGAGQGLRPSPLRPDASRGAVRPAVASGLAR